MLKRPLTRRLILASGAAAAATAGRARAQSPPATVAVVQTTRSTSDWPLQVAEKIGFFKANGIAAEVAIVGSSASVAQQLAAGSADIGTVSTVQAIEAIQNGAPFVEVLRNTLTTPYVLVGRKGLTTLAALKGKTVIVGGPNDITRVFIDRVLASAKFAPDDWTYTYAGSTGERYAALVNGGVDAAIVQPPWSFLAASEGYPLLADVLKYFPTFPTTGYAARLGWTQSRPDLVIAFLKSFLEGVRWLADPANKARAIAILVEATNSRPDDALKSYDLYLGRRLFVENGRFAPGDFSQVIETLVAAKQIPAPAPPATKFYNNTWVDAAYAKLGPARRR